jgi:hypothetical protein
MTKLTLGPNSIQPFILGPMSTFSSPLLGAVECVAAGLDTAGEGVVSELVQHLKDLKQTISKNNALK